MRYMYSNDVALQATQKYDTIVLHLLTLNYSWPTQGTQEARSRRDRFLYDAKNAFFILPTMS